MQNLRGFRSAALSGLAPNQLLEQTAYQSRVWQVAALPAKPAPANGRSSTATLGLKWNPRELANYQPNPQLLPPPFTSLVQLCKIATKLSDAVGKRGVEVVYF